MADQVHTSERFERIAGEYGPALARLAAAYARDKADRDDLLQEILVAIWRALPSFRGDASERTFVFRIAHNRGITFATRRRPAQPMDLETLVDPRPDPASTLAFSDRHERLMAAVHRLAEPQRQCVMLNLEGLSNRQIAEVQGATENNVAVRLTRARKALRELLGESGDEL
jgi:RNA polymerase sigma factor (sigma-70 family)